MYLLSAGVAIEMLEGPEERQTKRRGQQHDAFIAQG
jgi:hypothetical protein